jgi:L-2-hydroxyglutarate oxidase LhgO
MHVFVVGAGVVGLAIARQAALAGHDVTVAEAAAAIGTGTSSRNSEVIHAGLYYPTHSLRAYHCVRGRHLLYEMCRSHGISHRKLGKLLVVTEQSDIPVLEALYAQATLNGVENLQMLTAGEAMRMEPELACVAAFHSPETGVIDSHRYMLAMRGDLEDRGGRIALRTPVERLSRGREGWTVHFGGADPGSVVADAVINAAGHGAQRLALATEGYPARVPRHVMAKGNYFKFARKAAFSRLIYPAPVPGGLGIHVTLDLGGAMRFGPDVEWIETENYDVDPRRADAFYAYIRKYFPRLPADSLVPDYAGIRPKLTGRGEPPADFMIDTPEQHGLAGLVHLFGIESPGLTSSLSIGEAVVASLSEKS